MAVVAAALFALFDITPADLRPAPERDWPDYDLTYFYEPQNGTVTEEDFSDFVARKLPAFYHDIYLGVRNVKMEEVVVLIADPAKNLTAEDAENALKRPYTDCIVVDEGTAVSFDVYWDVDDLSEGVPPLDFLLAQLRSGSDLLYFPTDIDYNCTLKGKILSRFNGESGTITNYDYIFVEKEDYLKYVDQYEIQNVGFIY